VTVAEIGDYSLQCGQGFRCVKAITANFDIFEKGTPTVRSG